MPFEFNRLDIPDVVLVIPKVFDDERGYFLESYRHSDFKGGGILDTFVQDNHSHSVGPVLRGLHYQKAPHAQGKLVSVVRGEIFDVAVDIRRGSPTFGHWVAATLSDTNHHMLYVPPGFAHGFCVTSAVADVAYKVTAQFAPDCDRGICWNDKNIQIEWPVNEPILSLKDSTLPPLNEVDNSFTY